MRARIFDQLSISMLRKFVEGMTTIASATIKPQKCQDHLSAGIGRVVANQALKRRRLPTKAALLGYLPERLTNHSLISRAP